MFDKITVRGVGHIFEFFVIPFSVILLIISLILKPVFSYNINYYIILAFGIIFLITGLVINILSMKIIIPAFKNNKLVTSGLFKYSRNPTYASVIYFTIPAFSFIFDSWIILASSVLAYILFRIFIVKEEKFLETKFGEEFLLYKKTTGLLFPLVFRKKSDK
jgi:protein-S-isoprenylcysteine O-methyltransferase Ste14